MLILNQNFAVIVINMFFIIIIVVIMLVIHHYIITFPLCNLNSILLLLEYIFVVVLVVVGQTNKSLIVYVDGLNLSIVINTGSEGFEYDM